MRLRIAFEKFVASSTFPSSSALVNHQPDAPTRAEEIAPQAKPGQLRSAHWRKKCTSVRRSDYVSTAAQASQQIYWNIQFFVLDRTRAFLFLVKKIFFRIEK
jgi:hypothetical protein